MELELPVVVGILATAIAVISAALGFLFDERNAQSAIMLGGYAAVAGMICTLGALAGRWPGLLLAIVTVAVLAHRLFTGMGNKQGGFFAVGLWLGLCLSCAVGYWGGGWLGLVLITVPTWVLFWGALFLIAPMLLPLKHRDSPSSLFPLPRGLRPTETAGDKGRAFRSLVTFSLGTNYPYLALENDEMVERVKGKMAGRFLGGPGIVLTGPAHAPVLWTGTEFTQLGKPGVTFTKRLERVFQTLDLRPQLRTFYVEAMTRDGIRVRAQVFCPFQLDTGKQQPVLGQPFPRDEQAINTAIQQQAVERGKRVAWDEGVTAAATRILRNLLAEYTWDQLAEAPEPFRWEIDDPFPVGVLADRIDTRAKIAARLNDDLATEFQSQGIRILGAGLGPVEPVDRSLIEKRIEAWRAQWERRVSVSLGRTRGREIGMIETAYQTTQMQLLNKILGFAKGKQNLAPDLLTQMAALRFVEALEEMAQQPDIQAALPQGATDTLAQLRRTLSQR